MSTHFARGSHRFVMEIPASGKVPTRCLFYAHPSPLCFILLYFPIWWIDQAPPLVRCSTFFWRDGQLVVILRQCHLPAPLCAVLHYAPTAFVVGSQQPQLGPDDFADKSHGSYQFIKKAEGRRGERWLVLAAARARTGAGYREIGHEPNSARSAS